MMRIRTTAPIFLTVALNTGCVFLPPNYVRIISPAPTSAGRSLVVFTRGIHVQSTQSAAVLLVSPSAALLFDVQGAGNRFELMLQAGPQFTVYRRIGERPEPLSNLNGTIPAGIDLKRVGYELRGYVDVFVARSDDDPYDAYFEHYPRTLRVVGYLVVPSPSDETADTWFMTRQLLVQPGGGEPSTQPLGDSKRVSTGDPVPLGDSALTLQPGLALEEAASRLLRLKPIDTRMLMPATFAERIRHWQ